MMARAALGDAIRNSVGQCWCEFTKEDGTRRIMRFQRFPVGPIKGTGRPAPDHVVRVWDVDMRGYRSIPVYRTHWVDLGTGKQEIV